MPPASPTLAHSGFLIPNAAGLTSPRMAEPDQIDFNTLANSKWGVIEGCQVTVSGTTAMVTAGLAVVNGVLVTVPNGSTSLGVGGALDRFDLLGVNQAGIFVLLPGDPSNDPVFKDVDVGVTVLAAVFCPAVGSNFTNNVIDKRKFVPLSLLTSVDPGDMLVQNKNSSGNHFTITGGGTLGWEGDTILQRTAPATLRLTSKLIVDDSIVAGGALTAKSITATERVIGQNLITGTALPGTGVNGALFQNENTGAIYVRQQGVWQQLATTASAQPVGAVLTSIEVPAVMIPLGWLPLDGRTIAESDYPRLFTLSALQGYISTGAGGRSMILPNANNRVLMTNWAKTPGTPDGPTSNRTTLTVDNMPAHNHGISMAAAGSGPLTGRVGRSAAHSHGISGGEHSHSISDPGHNHNGAEWINQSRTAIIAVVWGGSNKIDALFNDRNHTYSVEALDWIAPSTTDITINSAGSTHGHILDQAGDHDHPITLDSAPSHTHDITQQDRGAGTPFDTTPSHLTVYTYIRS